MRMDEVSGRCRRQWTAPRCGGLPGRGANGSPRCYRRRLAGVHAGLRQVGQRSPFPRASTALDRPAPTSQPLEDVMRSIGRALGPSSLGCFYYSARCFLVRQSPSTCRSAPSSSSCRSARQRCRHRGALLAERLTTRWNQPVVVENRPGGDAVVAINAFIGAKDDHTLLTRRPPVYGTSLRARQVTLDRARAPAGHGGFPTRSSAWWCRPRSNVSVRCRLGWR